MGVTFKRRNTGRCHCQLLNTREQVLLCCSPFSSNVHHDSFIFILYILSIALCSACLWSVKGNPQKHRESMQTPHKKAQVGQQVHIPNIPTGRQIKLSVSVCSPRYRLGTCPVSTPPHPTCPHRPHVKEEGEEKSQNTKSGTYLTVGGAITFE